MKKLTCFILFFYITSCNNIEFIYNDDKNLINPLYNKTNIVLSGVDLVFMRSYVPMFFGNDKNNDYNLSIYVEERKTKKSIKSNQATSNLRYELRFFYILVFNKYSCKVYEKEILSSFSIIPKSAGYNYGTDASLEKKYELAVTDNLNQFVSFLSGVDINSCL